MTGGHGLPAGGCPWELMGTDVRFLEAPARSATRAQTGTGTRCGAMNPGGRSPASLPLHCSKGSPSLQGLLPPGDWTLGLTHYKPRANFCPAAGKRKTKTGHPCHFGSLVTFEWVNVNKCAGIPLCAWESRQNTWLELAHGRYAQNPKNKRL